DRGATGPVGLVENHVKHRHEIAGRGVDHLQYLGDRNLARQSRVPFGLGFREFVPQFRYGPLKLGDHPVLRRSHAFSWLAGGICQPIWRVVVSWPLTNWSNQIAAYQATNPATEIRAHPNGADKTRPHR